MSVPFDRFAVILPKGSTPKIMEFGLDEVREAVASPTKVLFDCTAGFDQCYRQGNARRMKTVDRRLTVAHALQPVCYACAAALEKQRSIPTFNLHNIFAGRLARYEELLEEEKRERAASQAKIDEFCAELTLPQLSEQAEGFHHKNTIGDNPIARKQLVTAKATMVSANVEQQRSGRNVRPGGKKSRKAANQQRSAEQIPS